MNLAQVPQQGLDVIKQIPKTGRELKDIGFSKVQQAKKILQGSGNINTEISALAHNYTQIPIDTANSVLQASKSLLKGQPLSATKKITEALKRDITHLAKINTSVVPISIATLKTGTNIIKKMVNTPLTAIDKIREGIFAITGMALNSGDFLVPQSPQPTQQNENIHPEHPIPADTANEPHSNREATSVNEFAA